MQIVLFQPEIPPNTGNVARLCAATGVMLNLIEPLGFSLDDRYLKRAGLDYWPHVKLAVWPDFASYRAEHSEQRLVMASARVSMPLQKFLFQTTDALVFGRESSGLPEEILGLSPHHIRIPTLDTVRSLNLSTAAGIVLYQAFISSGALAV